MRFKCRNRNCPSIEIWFRIRCPAPTCSPPMSVSKILGEADGGELQCVRLRIVALRTGATPRHIPDNAVEFGGGTSASSTPTRRQKDGVSRWLFDRSLVVVAEPCSSEIGPIGQVRTPYLDLKCPNRIALPRLLSSTTGASVQYAPILSSQTRERLRDLGL
jgi:hypothetical protein